MVVGGISEGDAGKGAWCERRRVEARRRSVYGICCRFAIAGNARGTWVRGFLLEYYVSR